MQKNKPYITIILHFRNIFKGFRVFICIFTCFRRILSIVLHNLVKIQLLYINVVFTFYVNYVNIIILYALMHVYLYTHANECKANTMKGGNTMKQISKGKVRDIYDLGDKLVLVTSDRVSAFDVVLPNTVPYKGAVLNRLSAFWFEFTRDIIPNHMISIKNEDMPKEFQKAKFEDRCMLVKKLKMLPIECIVRGYITGSGWESYKETGSVCGIKLPDGLQESEKLPFPIYTPTTKAVEGHDEHISFEETVKLLGEDLATQVRDKSIEIYSTCAEYAKTRGIIIADTKFEFGIDENGTLVLADEVLTPDSSRFWPADEYEVGKSQKSYDKQYLRDWLKNSGWDKTPPAPEIPEKVIAFTTDKYLDAFETLTNIAFF